MRINYILKVFQMRNKLKAFSFRIMYMEGNYPYPLLLKKFKMLPKII